MARALKAVKPQEVIPGKAKIIISGKSGVGKTFGAMEFPKVYYFDIEGGGEQPQYRKRLAEMDGVYFGREQGSQDFATIIEETQTLASVEHDRLTVIYDSFTKAYNLAAAIAEDSVGSDYGRDKKEANKPTRKLMRWLEAVDLNVILVCHSKDKWERVYKNGQPELVCTGTTFDGWDKMEYDLDLWLEIVATKNPKAPEAVVRKSRLEGFPVNSRFRWCYSEFADRYGRQYLESAAKPVTLASSEQVTEVQRLVSLMKVPEEITDKWLSKAKAETWAEMPSDALQKCIDHLKGQLAGAAA
jgi:hypothetical protein